MEESAAGRTVGIKEEREGRGEQAAAAQWDSTHPRSPPLTNISLTWSHHGTFRSSDSNLKVPGKCFELSINPNTVKMLQSIDRGEQIIV